MTDSIEAPMADWSTNYLSPESCVLSTGSERRFLHTRFSSDRLPGACHQRPSDTGMRTAANGGGLCDCGRLLDGPPSLAESRKGEPS